MSFFLCNYMQGFCYSNAKLSAEDCFKRFTYFVFDASFSLKSFYA